jgi:Protein of unknown function (DUF3455)
MKRLTMAAALLLGFGGTAMAQEVAPPKGSASLLEVAADGVQIYTCEAKSQSYAWVFRGPEAALFDASGRQIGTHGAGPRWTFADGSSIIGEKVAEAPAPEPNAIAWLLLRVKSHDGTGQLNNAVWVRRANTRGGAAPVGGCDAAHSGETARMRYSAIYQFFGQ